MEQDVCSILVHQIEVFIVAPVRDCFHHRLDHLLADGISGTDCIIETQGDATCLEIDTPRPAESLVEGTAGEGGGTFELDVEAVRFGQYIQILSLGINRSGRTEEVAHLPGTAHEDGNVVLLVAGTSHEADAYNKQRKEYLSDKG